MDDALYRQHDELEEAHWWFLGRRAIVRTMLRRIEHGSRELAILDAGCGTGGMLGLLKEFGHPVGVDSSIGAVERARRKTGCKVELGALPSQIPFEATSFDLVTAFDCIEHVEDDAAALLSIGHLLLPRGVFICTVPAFQCLWSVHDDLNGHRRRYTRSGLRAKLQNAGFVVETITYFNTILFPVVLCVRFGSKLLHRQTSDFTIPAFGLNRVLALIFGAERFIVPRLSLPFGVSILAVARKPAVS
jgi:SAM-dependent methyltransferase